MAIWIMEGERTQCKKASEYVLDTVKDNLEVLVQLSDEFWDKDPDDQADKNLQARLLSMACAVSEKLVLLNIYSRNPILLLPEKQVKKEMFLVGLSYKHFDADWLFEKSSEFISIADQWNLLDHFYSDEGLPLVEEFATSYHYTKLIRNKYLHVFVKGIAPKSFYLIRSFIWILILRLLNNLPSDISIDADSFLEDCGLDASKIEELRNLEEEGLIEKVTQTFPDLVDKLAAVQGDTEKRMLMLRQMMSEKSLAEKLPVYDVNGDQVILYGPNGEEAPETESRAARIMNGEIRLDCPKCETDHGRGGTGYISAHVSEVYHNQNSDGEYEVWSDPSDADIEFEHFYCISCGFFTDDYYLLEKLGYQEILSHKFWVDWNINEGVTAVTLAKHNGVEIKAPY